MNFINIKSDKGKIIVNELNKINLNYILNKKLKKINKEKKKIKEIKEKNKKKK